VILTVLVLVLGIIPYTIAIREGRTAHREAARARLAESQAWAEQARDLRRGKGCQRKSFGTLTWRRLALIGLSGQPGRRIRSLEILQKSRCEIHPSLELRNEAIACLALSDMRIARDMASLRRSGFCNPAGSELSAVRPRVMPQGVLLYIKHRDDKEIMALKAAGTAGSASRMWFSPNGPLPCRVLPWR